MHSQHPALVGFADILPQQGMEEWSQFRLEGEQYLKLAEGALRKQKKNFTAEILYNLIAMGIEKLVMAALMEIGRLPYNHTMHDLADALETWLPEAIQGMADLLRALDSYQEICDPYTSTIRTPTMEEIQSMLDLARQLEQRLNPARSSAA